MNQKKLRTPKMPLKPVSLSTSNCDPKFLKEFLSNYMLNYPVDANGVVMLNKEPEFIKISEKKENLL